MQQKIRKAIVAVAALLTLAAVPVSAQASTQAWGGFGEWPVSSRLDQR